MGVVVVAVAVMVVVEVEVVVIHNTKCAYLAFNTSNGFNFSFNLFARRL
jgi:hypothetical protein